MTAPRELLSRRGIIARKKPRGAPREPVSIYVGRECRGRVEPARSGAGYIARDAAGKRIERLHAGRRWLSRWLGSATRFQDAGGMAGGVRCSLPSQSKYARVRCWCSKGLSDFEAKVAA